MMLKTTRKKRPPFVQLMESASIARNMQITKGLISSKSIFDKLLCKPEKTVLPGFPSYLPSPWLMDRAKQAVFDITKKWVLFNDGDCEKQERFDLFSVYAIRRIQEIERKWRSKMRHENLEGREFEPLATIFSSQRVTESAMAIKLFIIDSFNISQYLKTNSSVSDYLIWFTEDWLPKLNDLWKKNGREKKPDA